MKICIFTANRSEYGLLKPLIENLQNDEYFDLKLIVGGAHLRSEFGKTVDVIKADGFNIDAQFDFLPTNLNEKMSYDAISRLVHLSGDWFQIEKPDGLIVLGDRFELLGIASSALVCNIPIIHISGGDITEGAIDNQVRHALTKMAHVHFPAVKEYRDNVIRMGEESWRICVAGEMGLDILDKFIPIPKEKLFKALSLDMSKRTVVATFHPETISHQMKPEIVAEICSLMTDHFDLQVLVTSAAADEGGVEINNKLLQLSQGNKNIIFVKSLGQERYYSMLTYASLVIGNSSSGITEVQSFKVPTVNIGGRQTGRLQNLNTINANLKLNEIKSAISEALSPSFVSQFSGKSNIYGDGKASVKIANFIKNLMTVKSKQEILSKKTVFGAE